MPSHSGLGNAPLVRYRIDWRPPSTNNWGVDRELGTKYITAPASSATLAAGDADEGTGFTRAMDYNFRITACNEQRCAYFFASNPATITVPDIDPPAPTVTGVSSPTPDGVYEAGAVIDITVTFSDTVTVTGTPTLTLSPGASEAVVDYTSGSGTDTLTFRYTVRAADFRSPLFYTGTDALGLPGGATIRDAGSNDAVLTLPASGTPGSLRANKDFRVIGSLPVILSPTDGATVTAARPDFRVRVGAAAGDPVLRVVRTAPGGGACATLTDADLFSATAVTANLAVSTTGDHILAAASDQTAGTHCYYAVMFSVFFSAPVKVTLDLPVPAIRLSREALEVDEGRTATYSVRLRTQPSEDVVIDIASDRNDVTVQPAQLTFTTSNWSSAKAVTVSAAADDDAANDTAALTHAVVDASSAAEYAGVTATLAVTVEDDETAGITLSALSESPVPENGSATYTVVLAAEPTNDVVITIATDKRRRVGEPVAADLQAGQLGLAADGDGDRGQRRRLAGREGRADA